MSWEGHAVGHTVGAIDDHPFMGTVLSEVVARIPGCEFVGLAPTVGDFLREHPRVDLAILDLRLQDGSAPDENISILREAGIATVVYTSGESRFLLRGAAQAGAGAVVRKSAPEEDLVAAVQAVLAGGNVMTADLAASIDSDERLRDARLSPREREVLAMYADGHTTVSVAQRLGLSVHTVDKYVKDIRAKYVRVGRESGTKVDLYKRAVEDGFIGEPGVW
ncbi:response regulator transcription factor [Brachybacterium phenoliresistens]|uniref:response regulator transcription factor n=1 Tax=Brachybacterium phenoliresistens TaxID=396014 RepID=UPI0031CFB937